MKLNLCIDIDGTITDAYYWLDLANQHFGKNLKPQDVTSYDIHEALKVPREEYNKFYEVKGKQMHRDAKVRENAKNVLLNLSNRDNIFYVTARSKEMKIITEEWFSKNNLPKGELFLLGTHYKVDKAKELSCDIFIEDRYENALEIASAGFKVLLMDCYYNRKSLIPGITRVFNWVEVYQEIEKYGEDIKKGTIKIA